MTIRALLHLVLAACVVAISADCALAHGGGHGRPPPPPEPPPEPPTPAPIPPPFHNPVTPPDVKPPTTPGNPNGPITPTAKKKNQNARRRASRSGGISTSWRVWWEYNREYLLGLRSRLRRSAVLTGKGDRRPDPMAGRRAEVRTALRELAADTKREEGLRASTLIALGRLSEPQDAELFLEVLLDSKEPDNVQEAAALGLGLMPPIEDADLRQKIRKSVDEILSNKRSRSHQVRGFLIIAAGMRSRADRVLTMNLALYGQKSMRDRSDRAALAYSMGIAHDAILLPDLTRAVRRGELGKEKLNDIGRSHACAALGLSREPMAVPTLVAVLKSRRAGMETRRGAALALGRLLREAELDAETTEQAQKALGYVFEKGRDKQLVSYAAIAMAGAREPKGIEELIRIVDRSGEPTVKPYAALALGLATERLDDKRAQKVRSFLARELGKTREIELGSALAIAAGMAGAQDAREELVARTGEDSLPAPVRGAAAEGLGLLGRPTPDAEKALLKALRDGPPDLVEGAAIGLGLLGHRGIARELANRLKSAKSGILQGRITLALGYLGQSTAVDPLLEILKDEKQRRVIRELSAVALGLLGDPREDDVLFELSAYFNYFATTTVTHELLTIF